MLLLHLVATPRTLESNTLRVSHAFIRALRERYGDVVVETLDLFTAKLPIVHDGLVKAKFSLMAGGALAGREAEAWCEVEALVRQFRAADVVLVSTPMWNLGLPYALKYYIDAIVQPGLTFSYESGAAVGLCKGQKMVCVTTRGGDYSPGGPMHAHDYLEPYLRTIFGFVGVDPIEFVNAQPMDMGLERREAAIEAAIDGVRRLARGREWRTAMRTMEPAAHARRDADPIEAEEGTAGTPAAQLAGAAGSA